MIPTQSIINNSKKRYHLILVVALILLNLNNVFASTFVGNGGNSGDLELQVTLNQVKDTNEVIKRKIKDNSVQKNLCTCNPDFQDYDFCNILKKLNAEQQLFCSEFIKSKSSEIYDLIQSSKVKMNWTESLIEVIDSDNNRSADAVTDRVNNQVTIQSEHFIRMQPHERLFLITHEFYHLTDFENSPIVDDQNLGPFNSKDGGKQLLNASAAAQVQLAFENGLISHYQASLSRSKYTSWNYFSVGINATKYSFNDSNFSFSNDQGFEFTYRLQPGALGFSITSINSKSFKNILSTISVREERFSELLGLTYRLVLQPTAPQNFLGQAHLVFEVGMEHLNGTITLSDDYVSSNETASMTSPYGAISFFIPLRHGIWLSAVGRIYQSKLKYKDANYEYFKNNSISMGVGYAF